MINATEKVKWMQWTEDAGMVIADLSWVTKKSIAEEVRLG